MQIRNVLALLADWANGLFAVLAAAYITGLEAVWWHFLLGMVFSHLPDLDAVPELLRRGRVAASAEHPQDHRDGLHYPLLLLPLCVLSPYFFGYWGWVLFLVVLLHFINDTYGTGWGIKLLWPFSSRSYKFLARRVNQAKQKLISDGEWEALSDEERRLRLVVSWSKAELPEYQRRWGMENWVDYCYLRPNWISAIEYGFFCTACVLAVSYLL